jgi:hypothetical protein
MSYSRNRLLLTAAIARHVTFISMSKKCSESSALPTEAVWHAIWFQTVLLTGVFSLVLESLVSFSTLSSEMLICTTPTLSNVSNFNPRREQAPPRLGDMCQHRGRHGARPLLSPQRSGCAAHPPRREISKYSAGCQDASSGTALPPF